MRTAILLAAMVVAGLAWADGTEQEGATTETTWVGDDQIQLEAEVEGDQPHVTSTTVTTADSASHLSLILWTGTYFSA